MSVDCVAEEKAGTRKPYTAPALRVLGTFQALTQTRTCAKDYNDGTGTGCNMSFKKS
jgi:hypothetical protein